jgi:hypothetical protein
MKSNRRTYEKQRNDVVKEGRSVLMSDGEKIDEKKHVNFDETLNINKEFQKLLLINELAE